MADALPPVRIVAPTSLEATFELDCTIFIGLYSASCASLARVTAASFIFAVSTALLAKFAAATAPFALLRAPILAGVISNAVLAA